MLFYEKMVSLKIICLELNLVKIEALKQLSFFSTKSFTGVYWNSLSLYFYI